MRTGIAVVVLLALAAVGVVLVIAHEEPQELRVRVIGPEGRVLGGIAGGLHLHFEDPETGGCVGVPSGSDNEGYTYITRKHRNAILCVWSPGCRVMRIEDPVAKQEVQLEYGIPVELTVVVDGELPRAPLSLELQIEYVSGPDYVKSDFVVSGEAWFQSPHTVRAERLVVPESRKLRVWFPAAGTYELEWTLMRRNDVRTPGHVSLGGTGHGPGRKSAQTLAVEDRDGQAFAFRVDPAQLASIRAAFE